ncbi:MAG: rhodanese-related sulfurtransferase [Candidatus Neomarinimicrobiota bacterium]
MNKKQKLYNRIDKKELRKSLANETFSRFTVTFYRYICIKSPLEMRDILYREWNDLRIFGRVYIAAEGINAQICVPEHKWSDFNDQLNSMHELKGMQVKRALDEGPSFYKLTIKVRKELVAYGIPRDLYDMKRVGNHLSAHEYNKAIEDTGTIVVDMRNYYESEIGRFDDAIIPDVETSKELLPEVKRLLQGKERDKVLLYCTGGIRCEKASSYLIRHGFKDVNQLQGGIIQYAHDIKEYGLESKFKGKNFVFDDRLGERITEDVIASCHLCGVKCDEHTDCNNDACHILFIQCRECSKRYEGCCSKECYDFASLPLDEQKKRRKDPSRVVSRTFFDSRIKPKLKA